MEYTEKKIDLFEFEGKMPLAHCISADFALGKGIAVEFRKRYNMQALLKSEYNNYVNTWTAHGKKGTCLFVNGVYNLVTKQNYYDKPTYRSLEQSLEELKELCIKNNVSEIAMPMIGCGLDKLKWGQVRGMINDTFRDTDIHIHVCYI